MNTGNTDFRKAVEGLVGASTREAPRQIARRHEHLLIGSLTRRPN